MAGRVRLHQAATRQRIQKARHGTRGVDLIPAAVMGWPQRRLPPRRDPSTHAATSSAFLRRPLDQSECSSAVLDHAARQRPGRCDRSQVTPAGCPIPRFPAVPGTRRVRAAERCADARSGWSPPSVGARSIACTCDRSVGDGPRGGTSGRRSLEPAAPMGAGRRTTRFPVLDAETTETPFRREEHRADPAPERSGGQSPLLP